MSEEYSPHMIKSYSTAHWLLPRGNTYRTETMYYVNGDYNKSHVIDATNKYVILIECTDDYDEKSAKVFHNEKVNVNITSPHVFVFVFEYDSKEYP